VNERTISVIALSSRDYPSFEAKLREAASWMEISAGQGADLAVLPETLNFYQGDGAENPNALRAEDVALEDWETATALLRDTAVRLGIAVTIPVLIREGDRLVNTFFLVSKKGEVLGSYRKRFPAYGEVLDGIAGETPEPLIDWDGIQVGGAICFDTWFSEVFDSQAAAGAQLFLVPSLWPGGSFLNASAIKLSVPIAVAYPAWSRIIDIDGREIVGGGYRNETLGFGFGSPVFTASLNFNRAAVHADRAQQKMVDVERAYGRRVGVRFDQQNCLFFVESRDPDLPVTEILERFELVTLQQYFRNYETARATLSK
jgi:predicted amidohydrolase